MQKVEVGQERMYQYTTMIYFDVKVKGHYLFGLLLLQFCATKIQLPRYNYFMENQ